MNQLYVKGIPVFLKEPNYEERLKKKSHRARKNAFNDDMTVKLPCLEWGNASVVFQFAWNEKLYDELVLFWESEYEEKGEYFNVELYKDVDNVIEWRVLMEKPYYRGRQKSFESVLENIQGNVLEAWETLSESFTEDVEIVYLSDFDYLGYADEDLI